MIPEFLSPEWVEAFNSALAGLPAADVAAAMPTGEGPISVVERILGAPDGDVDLLLTCDAGHWQIALEPDDSDRLGHVTISLAYETAADLATGALTAGTALARGLVRVRGDLNILLAVQSALADAAATVAGALARPPRA